MLWDLEIYPNGLFKWCQELVWGYDEALPEYSNIKGSEDGEERRGRDRYDWSVEHFLVAE